MKGEFRRKPDEADNETNFSFVYTNLDLQTLNTQYLQYIAHVCRRSNINLTKLSPFFIPSKNHVRDPWINISKLLGGISIEEAKRKNSIEAWFIIISNLFHVDKIYTKMYIYKYINIRST